MRELLIVNGHEYSDYITAEGLEVKPVERGVRTITDLAGNLHKFRSALKYQVTATLAMVPDQLYRQLAEDVSPVYFSASFTAHGEMLTRTCVSDTGAVAVLQCELDDGLYWSTVQVTITER